MDSPQLLSNNRKYHRFSTSVRGGILDFENFLFRLKDKISTLRLSSYCNSWMLSINPKKTKVMIFQKRAKKCTESSFHIDNEIIEIVQNYTYLGTLISSTDNFSMARDKLKEKALHALFSLRKHNNNIRIRI